MAMMSFSRPVAVLTMLLISITCRDAATNSERPRPCIISVDANAATFRVSYQDYNSEDYTVHLRLKHYVKFPKPTLLTVVYIYTHTSVDNYQYLLVCDNSDADCKDRSFAGNSSVAAYVASRSVAFSILGAMLYDVLTLGAMDVAERVNVTGLALPKPVCPGKEDSVYAATIRMLLKLSDIDGDNWSITPHSSDSVSLESSQVTLFMSTGLLSLFLTFVAFPLLAMFAFNSCCLKVPRKGLYVAYQSALISSSLISFTFITFWMGMSVYYYLCDDIDDILFPSPFFSPMSMCLVFYGLTGMTSFAGGILFSKCKNIKTRMSPLQHIGSGFFSASMSTAVFHSFFLLLAIMIDPLTVISYLIVFLTTVMLIFITMNTIILQYGKTGFRGHFCLVVMMQMIIFILYIISTKSFGKLTLKEDDYVANKSYFAVVVVLSLCASTLSVSILAMVAAQNRGKSRAGERGFEANGSTRTDPENPISKKDDQASEAGGAGEGRGLQVVRRKSHVADLAAVAGEMGFVVLIPSVVQAWQNRPRSTDTEDP